MTKLTFKNISIIGLSLLGISALASIFAISSEEDEQNAQFAAGIIVPSTGTLLTAEPGDGPASYTATWEATDTGAGPLTVAHSAWNNTGHDTTRNG